MRHPAVRRSAGIRLRAGAGGLVLVFAKVFHPTMLGPRRKGPASGSRPPGRRGAKL